MNWQGRCVSGGTALMTRTRRVCVLLILASLAVSAGGCGTVYFDVPEGDRVKLLEIDAPTTVHVEKEVWFALWGDITLSDNHTATIIAQHNLKEVRLENLYSGSDSLLNMLTGIVTLSRRRIIVEGNPAPPPAPAPVTPWVPQTMPSVAEVRP